MQVLLAVEIQLHFWCRQSELKQALPRGWHQKATWDFITLDTG